MQATQPQITKSDQTPQAGSGPSAPPPLAPRPAGSQAVPPLSAPASPLGPLMLWVLVLALGARPTRSRSGPVLVLAVLRKGRGSDVTRTVKVDPAQPS